jgi:hypothetical protein
MIVSVSTQVWRSGEDDELFCGEAERVEGELAGEDFEAVQEAVGVGIGRGRIGMMNHQFIFIAQPVAVRICVGRSKG